MQQEQTRSTAAASLLPQPLLTERDAARYINMSVFYLRQARRQGGGPRYQSFGRSIRYHLDDLEDWRRSRRSPARADRTGSRRSER